MNEKLMIGWSEADITPDFTDKKIPLYGQYYTRLATGIHSRLKTVACAMSSGDQSFINLSIDTAGCPRQFVDRLKEDIAKLDSTIDTSRVFVNAIHTHSAPSLAFKVGTPATGVSASAWDKLRDQMLTPEEFADFAIPIIAQNVVNAWKNRAPGGIATGFGEARIGHCRRAVFANGKAEMYGDTTRQDFIGMEAGEDTGVEMLFTYDANGKKTGMLLNVACPSQNMESTYVVSSDFAGATRELLKAEYGEDFHTIYQISPAGCQSPRDLVRHYTTEPDFWHADGVPVLANRLLAAVKSATPGEIDYAPVLKSEVVEVVLPRRRASYTDYKEAQAELARLTAIMPEDQAFEAFCAETHANEKIDGPGPYDSKLHHFVLIKNAQAVIRRYEDQDANPNYIFPMNVVRLGDIAIANNPFELYLYYGQNIKARSKAFQTFLVQLSGNGNYHAGYLPSPDAEKFGGYGGLIINGQVGSDGGYKLADRTVEEINKLFED
ncbi:MAG: hypothetical protein E7042_08625 [Lentisphaerae bacterium]|nr:hypothetical protein [Lentisphaerota bacterium]